MKGNILIISLLVIATLATAATVSIGNLGIQQQAQNYQQNQQQLFWQNYRQIQLQLNNIKLYLVPQILILKPQASLVLDTLYEEYGEYKESDVSYSIHVEPIDQNQYVLYSTANSHGFNTSNTQYQIFTIDSSQTNPFSLLMVHWGLSER